MFVSSFLVILSSYIGDLGHHIFGDIVTNHHILMDVLNE